MIAKPKLQSWPVLVLQPGYALPPFVIYNRTNLNPEYTIGADRAVPGTTYGLSQNGWMDTEIIVFSSLNFYTICMCLHPDCYCF